MKRTITIILGLSLFIHLNCIGQSNGKAFVNDTETSVMDFTAKDYKLNFPINSEEIKSAYMVKAKNFQYAIEIFLEDAENCNTEAITNWQGSYAESSLSAMAKSGESFSYQLDGDEVNSAITSELNDCGWPTKESKAVLKLGVFNKSAKIMSISVITLSIPANSKSKNLANSSSQVFKLFKEGLASQSIKNSQLEKAVEGYMENKWNSKNISTIHINSLKYTNVSSTAFNVEGYYITRKTDNSCHYNSFYGTGTKESTSYSISTFNSMNSEIPMDCVTADKLKNL
jgi:hypothetical protein